MSNSQHILEHCKHLKSIACAVSRARHCESGSSEEREQLNNAYELVEKYGTQNLDTLFNYIERVQHNEMIMKEFRNILELW